MRGRDFLELVTKYDRRGPRYTSYPTANLFDPSVSGDVLVRWLREHPAPGEPLSLYAHIPFCKSLCWYCGCNMKVSRNMRLMDTHFGLLLEEIERMAPLVDDSRLVNQVHLGGGTPNYLPPAQLKTLLDSFRQLFHYSEDVEISCELDPRLLEMDQIEALAEAGVNRVSIGVQDFDAEVARAIHRENSVEMVARCFRGLRAAGIEAINIDLIYGLPLQTHETFAATLDEVVALAPSRIALFSFAYLPESRPQMKLIRAKDLPTPREKLTIMTEAVDRLEEAGYTFIGIDHFARPDDELAKAWRDGSLHRNFQGYTTRAGSDMLGFGMSAISMMERLYVQNHSRITDWEAAIREDRRAVARGYQLNDEDVRRRAIINRIMCRYTVDEALIESEVGTDFDVAFPGVREALEGMAADGLLDHEDRLWRATRAGRFLLRNIAMLFDHHLVEGVEARFSKTI